MITRIVVWTAGFITLVALLASCSAPIYIYQAVAPGTLACVDSKTFEEMSAPPAAKPGA